MVEDQALGRLRTTGVAEDSKSVCHSWGQDCIGTHITGTTKHLTVKKLSSLFVFPAYSKTVTLGKDEFHLHLVDTAGQVPVAVGCPNVIVQP
jgi:hypothetical protein